MSPELLAFQNEFKNYMAVTWAISGITESWGPAFPMTAHLPVLPNQAGPSGCHGAVTASDPDIFPTLPMLCSEFERPLSKGPGLGSHSNWQVTAGRAPFSLLLPGQAGLGEDPKASDQEEHACPYVKVVPDGNSRGPLGKRATDCWVNLESQHVGRSRVTRMAWPKTKGPGGCVMSAQNWERTTQRLRPGVPPSGTWSALCQVHSGC